ncbi:hypothetical protein [Hydrotalea sp.]|uniref:hypothetical protein n=1 Tax=Hydrotalea sp. TaxID=2881279 RepID=UPI003D1221BE
MKAILKYGIFALTIMFLFQACSKEYSYETGKGYSGVAIGTLQDSTGNCQNVFVNGTYVVDSVLTDSNYIVVTVNIISPGKYYIFTDTANGFWFADSSIVLSTGTQNIKLKGYGKPILPVDANFVITFGSSACQFTIPYNTAVIGNYFPTTAGSYWTYNDSQLNDTITTHALSVLANVANTGQTYAVFVDRLGDTSLYRRSGNTYYTYGSIYPDPSVQPVEYAFLKAGVPAGTSWDSPIVSVVVSNQNIKVKYHFTLLGSGLTASYNGNNFTNVIKVQLDIQALVPPAINYATAQTSYFYYAEGIGLIAIEVPGSTTVMPYNSTLAQWHVN